MLKLLIRASWDIVGHDKASDVGGVLREFLVYTNKKARVLFILFYENYCYNCKLKISD